MRKVGRVSAPSVAVAIFFRDFRMRSVYRYDIEQSTLSR